MYVKKRQLVSLIMLIAAFMLFITFAKIDGDKNADMKAKKDLWAYSPIISTEAREKYAEGSITKEKAENMIEKHLTELVDVENISSWTKATNGRYSIVLNDGTLFSYSLK